MEKSSFFIEPITTSKKVYDFLKNHISYEQEEVWVICLSSLKKPVVTKKIFIGTVDQCVIHPRDVFRTVITSNATSFILCHSHPSGNTTPSFSDHVVTQDFKRIAKLIQIEMDDHLILSKNSYYSFKDENYL